MRYPIRIKYVITGTTPEGEGVCVPPTPPEGWHVPRVGEGIYMGPEDNYYYRVTDVAWDYFTPGVAVFIQFHWTDYTLDSKMLRARQRYLTTNGTPVISEIAPE